jgi:hypothetical protein
MLAIESKNNKADKAGRSVNPNTKVSVKFGDFRVATLAEPVMLRLKAGQAGQNDSALIFPNWTQNRANRLISQCAVQNNWDDTKQWSCHGFRTGVAVEGAILTNNDHVRRCQLGHGSVEVSNKYRDKAITKEKKSKPVRRAVHPERRLPGQRLVLLRRQGALHDRRGDVRRRVQRLECLPLGLCVQRRQEMRPLVARRISWRLFRIRACFICH